MKMKTTLRISVLLNLVLLGGLICLLANRQREKTAALPVLPEVKPPGQVMATAFTPPPSGSQTESFRWSQLTSTKDYRLYIANLRAMGCPEVTIEDIVRGDTGRAFAWERSQLALDESGGGPWSQQAQRQIALSLLRQPESPGASPAIEITKDPDDGGKAIPTSRLSENAQSEAPDYPLLLQNVNWSALGFNSSQQADIAQVRQQYLDQMSHPDPNLSRVPNQNSGPADRNPNPTGKNKNNSIADSGPEDQLRALLGAQGYATYQQQQYYAWYQPQVLANADGGNLTINPGGSSSK
jgi:hypothetical protein